MYQTTIFSAIFICTCLWDLILGGVSLKVYIFDFFFLVGALLTDVECLFKWRVADVKEEIQELSKKMYQMDEKIEALIYRIDCLTDDLTGKFNIIKSDMAFLASEENKQYLHNDDDDDDYS